MSKIKNLQELKTFEDACQVLGIDSEKVIPDFSMYPEIDRSGLEADAKLMIIVRSANKLSNKGKEWIPDYTDITQYKYEPYFYLGSSGFRYYGYDGWNTASDVGSRLCFISYDTMKHVVDTFIKLYKAKYVR